MSGGPVFDKDENACKQIPFGLASSDGYPLLATNGQRLQGSPLKAAPAVASHLADVHPLQTERTRHAPNGARHRKTNGPAVTAFW